MRLEYRFWSLTCFLWVTMTMTFLSIVAGNSGATLAVFAACGLAVDIVRWRYAPDLRQSIKMTYDDLHAGLNSPQKRSISKLKIPETFHPWEAIFLVHGLIHIVIYWAGLTKYLVPPAGLLGFLNHMKSIIAVAPTLSIDQAAPLQGMLCQITLYFLTWLILYSCLTFRTAFGAMYKVACAVYPFKAQRDADKNVVRRRYIKEPLFVVGLLVLPLLILRWLLTGEVQEKNYEDLLRSTPTGLFIASSILASALVAQPFLYIYLLINRCLAAFD